MNVLDLLYDSQLTYPMDGDEDAGDGHAAARPQLGDTATVNDADAFASEYAAAAAYDDAAAAAGDGNTLPTLPAPTQPAKPALTPEELARKAAAAAARRDTLASMPPAWKEAPAIASFLQSEHATAIFAALAEEIRVTGAAAICPPLATQLFSVLAAVGAPSRVRTVVLFDEAPFTRREWTTSVGGGAVPHEAARTMRANQRPPLLQQLYAARDAALQRATRGAAATDGGGLTTAAVMLAALNKASPSSASPSSASPSSASPSPSSPPAPSSADLPPWDASLERWTRQGVLPLYWTLTLAQGRRAQHAALGWGGLVLAIVAAVLDAAAPCAPLFDEASAPPHLRLSIPRMPPCVVLVTVGTALRERLQFQAPSESAAQFAARHDNNVAWVALRLPSDPIVRGKKEDLEAALLGKRQAALDAAALEAEARGERVKPMRAELTAADALTTSRDLAPLSTLCADVAAALRAVRAPFAIAW